MYHDAGRPPEQTGSSMDSRTRLGRALWIVVAFGLGWAVVWSGWAVAHLGWVPARQDGLTLAAVSATAAWLSAVLGALALGDLVRFNGRWARGEFHSTRRVTFHPLWLPPVLFLAGLAVGRVVW
jgi:hypothetical protein